MKYSLNQKNITIADDKIQIFKILFNTSFGRFINTKNNQIKFIKKSIQRHFHESQKKLVIGNWDSIDENINIEIIIYKNFGKIIFFLKFIIKKSIIIIVERILKNIVFVNS